MTERGRHREPATPARGERDPLQRSLLAILARRGHSNLAEQRRVDAAETEEAKRRTPRRFRRSIFP